MHWIFVGLVGLFFGIHQTECSGVFELRLKSFENENGKDSVGNCCSGVIGTKLECRGSCRTRFRVCMKNYQAQIDTTTPCTFGDVVTPVLGGNSVNMLESQQEGFVNPIKFPFNFTWPGTFSLIVEAWHDSNETSRDVLIARLSTQRWLDVGETWTEDQHRTSTSMMRYEFRVRCDAHYYGTGCEKLCRPRDDNFGHFTCSAEGKRVCLSGWHGEYCTKPSCLPGCNEQHGHCNKPDECICHPGWTGALCNECERYPGCMYGTCQTSWQCMCKEGWGGMLCNLDLNYCTNNKPCKNGGTCFNRGEELYTCMCPPAYTGVDCERSLDECAHSPCLNGGSCVSNGTQHKCECTRGWTGMQCDRPVHSCDRHPCRNGGTCVPDEGNGAAGRCQCAVGYSGADCALRLDDCVPNPCLNNGSCVHHASGFQCVCPSGFDGMLCETNVDDCGSNPCLNGGTCVDQINEFRCKCVPGFVGRLCRDMVDYCLAKPCANGGTCHRLTNDYECSCRSGFSGKDCSVEADECGSGPCTNGATCVNRVNGFECLCTADFRGRTCSEQAAAGDMSARVSFDSGLSTEHVVVIATLSVFVPLLVLVAAVVVMCLKQRRKREQARADEEARMQNEQNAVHSTMGKRAPNAIGPEPHVIKNSWGKCTNNVMSVAGPADECAISNAGSASDSECFPKTVADTRPVYTLQRTRSHKQLNTDTAVRRTSTLLSGKLHELHEPSAEVVCTAGRLPACGVSPAAVQPAHHDKRTSVLSSAPSLCATSDASLLKRPLLDKEPANGGVAAGGPAAVYVIEEHFHRPDALHAAMFATEV